MIFTMMGHLPGLIYALVFIVHFKRNNTGLVERYYRYPGGPNANSSSGSNNGYQPIGDLESQQGPLQQQFGQFASQFTAGQQQPAQVQVGSSSGQHQQQAFSGHGDRLGTEQSGDKHDQQQHQQQGNSDELPPSYDDSVEQGANAPLIGDHKIQRN
ncbi:unnamed protein product [Ambrosiozyma monospora]|uniref:Unnamed protein product n=1 Tax=Ambrosiozyma monospora TaxID=43982 RepID=A0A9W6YS41_AMBMO|nr:unnamed protein product [Ambrosiozyma monospora]